MSTFGNLRKEIDKIDANLISLLGQRSSVVEKVKNFKDSTPSHEFTLYIKPDREHAILTKIIQEGQGYSREFFYNTWRGIISASNFLEQNLNLIATCEQSHHDIFHHFGGQKIPTLETTRTAFELLQSNTHHILAFKESNISALNLLKTYTDIKIFAITHSISSERTFLCGKITLQNFSQPAVFLTTHSTGIFFNKEAKIFISDKIDEFCIGAYYLLPF